MNPPDDPTVTRPGATPAATVRTAPRVSRLATIAVVLAVIALSAFGDRSSTGRQAPLPASATAAAATSAAMPVAAPGAALSSSWFCAGPVAAAAGASHLADGRLVIANAGLRSLHGKVTFVPSSGPSVSQAIEVGAADRVVIPEKTTTAAPYLGAVVDLDGGQVVVQQVVSGSAGTSSSACATSGSTSWHFAAGTTQESSTLSLSLLNPYPDDAIADFSFTTEQGQENPQDFQGIVIPAGTMAGFDLGSHLRRRASVATTVTLRVGRLVAFETQTVQAQSPGAAATAVPGSTPWPPGVSVTLGAPSAGTAWWWPSGAAGDGTAEQYVIYNPGSAPAQVSLAFVLDQGSADPFEVNVDPHSVAVVVTNSESRVPKGIGHAAELHSTNGVGVVGERLVLAASPASQTGVAEVFGSRATAARWLVPGNGATDAVAPTLSVFNPGSAAVTVSISPVPEGLTAVAGQGAVEIPAHHRYLLSPAAAGPEWSLVVAARGSGQVVVENDTSPAKGIGIDAAIGIPLG